MQGNGGVKSRVEKKDNEPNLLTYKQRSDQALPLKAVFNV